MCGRLMCDTLSRLALVRSAVWELFAHEVALAGEASLCQHDAARCIGFGFGLSTPALCCGAHVDPFTLSAPALRTPPRIQRLAR